MSKGDKNKKNVNKNSEKLDSRRSKKKEMPSDREKKKTNKRREKLSNKPRKRLPRRDLNLKEKTANLSQKSRLKRLSKKRKQLLLRNPLRPSQSKRLR